MTRSSYLTFTIGNEVFACEVYKVLEVLEFVHITTVPNMPVFIKGIINFRGEIVPIIDSRVKFGLPEQSQKSIIIVLDIKYMGQERRIGALADSVKDVIEINTMDILPVPKIGKTINTDFLLGVIKSNDRFIMVLDVDKVYSEEELNVAANATGFSDLIPENSEEKKLNFDL